MILSACFLKNSAHSVALSGCFNPSLSILALEIIQVLMPSEYIGSPCTFANGRCIFLADLWQSQLTPETDRFNQVIKQKEIGLEEANRCISRDVDRGESNSVCQGVGKLLVQDISESVCKLCPGSVLSGPTARILHFYWLLTEYGHLNIHRRPYRGGSWTSLVTQ